jgi:GNAT superfamily N-acetyltransferase
LERSLRLAHKLIRRKLAHADLDEKIINAALQARQETGCLPTGFGDCGDTSKKTVAILKENGISAKVVDGLFITNVSVQENWDHSWVEIGNVILDPTVDQFLSEMDVDVETEVPGVYYSAVDGGWLAGRYQRSYGRQSALVDSDETKSDDLDALLSKLQRKYPYPELFIIAYESDNSIELAEIEVKNKGQGIGTKVIQELQEYARRVGKPIVLRPEPEPRKKSALFKFYKDLGFVINKGRKTDYTLSSPFALTMYWKP